jgi:hypothetical protein
MLTMFQKIQVLMEMVNKAPSLTSCLSEEGHKLMAEARREGMVYARKFGNPGYQLRSLEAHDARFHFQNCSKK